MTPRSPPGSIKQIQNIHWLTSRTGCVSYVPILGLANAPIVETKFLELAMSLLDFSPRIPLGTFSILLINVVIATIWSSSSQLSNPIFFALSTKRGMWRPQYKVLVAQIQFLHMSLENYHANFFAIQIAVLEKRTLKYMLFLVIFRPNWNRHFRPKLWTAGCDVW